MSTQRKNRIAISMLALSACAVSSNAEIAISFDDPRYYGFEGSFVVAWAFTTTHDIVATELGYYDADGDGLSADHAVGLFRASDGSMVISTIVSTDDALDGHFRYADSRDVLLNQGETYFVAGFDPLGSADHIGIPAVSALSFGQGIVFEGWQDWSESDLSVPGNPQFGSDFWASTDGYMVNANFRYTVPAPGSVALLMLGGLVARSRRTR